MSENKSNLEWWQTLVPVAAGILAVELIPIANELLRWIVAAIAVTIVFTLCLMVKH